MRENEIHPAPGSHKRRRRVGRGNSSGRGTYAGKGMKGQQARSGAGISRGFEGGQLKLIKRLPHKPGFKNPFRVEHQPVNLSRLSDLPAGTEVSPESLRKLGIIKTLRFPVAILGDGELSGPLSVRAHRFSLPARARIEAAGGTVELLETPKIRRPR
ncbi:MAG: 50S ribosomal protein L15 [Chloroflexi bacterium]|nr:50S ribosomal protein L15 [Chloroflexota bacterium]